MKEVPLAHFDVTPEQFQTYFEDHLSKNQAYPNTNNQATVDDLVVEEICREVAILKELDHPNITKYFTSFAEG